MRARLFTAPVATLHPPPTPAVSPALCVPLRRVRKLLETDFFERAASQGLLPRAAHKWNLGSLSYFILFTFRSA